MFESSGIEILSMKKSIRYGRSKIDFDLQYVDRKTLGIRVHPNKRVFVLAPNGSDERTVLEKVKGKAAWIRKQQEFFLSFHPFTPKRKFVSGETHLYLGRQYRLKVKQSSEEGVKLIGKFLIVNTVKKGDRNRVQMLLNEWYVQRAAVYFKKLFAELLPITSSFYNGKSELHYRWMSKRWGSCNSKGKITLNLELIKAPKRCIEYVIIHEFCHLAYLNHSRSFYKLLEDKLPDWRASKEYLEHFMA